MTKEIPIYLERKHTNHICKEMRISKPMRTIRVFEKDIKGYDSHEFPPNENVIIFEVTNREMCGRRVFREIYNN